MLSHSNATYKCHPHRTATLPIAQVEPIPTEHEVCEQIVRYRSQRTYTPVIAKLDLDIFGESRLI